MVMRSLIGSLAAVGVIGGLAAALPERTSVSSPPAASQPSFGALPKQFAASSPSQADPEQQSLLKLAAYPIGRESAPTPAPVSSPAAPVGGVSDTTSADLADDPAPTAPSAGATAVPRVRPWMPARAAEPAVQAPPAPKLAALPPPPAPTPQAAASASQVNINRASVAEMDHLPGAGRVGVAIARRRPYRTVEDLVRKRVLRASTFARIRSTITVD